MITALKIFKFFDLNGIFFCFEVIILVVQQIKVFINTMEEEEEEINKEEIGRKISTHIY